MNEAEFQRALLLTLLIGGAVVAIGATTLFFAFRAFGRGKKTYALLAGLIFFIFVCCAALFVASFR